MKAQMILVKEATKKGEYKRTLVDDMKDKADFLIQAIDSKYTLYTRKGIELVGRGIKKVNNGTFVLTESAYKKVRSEYNVEYDL